MRGTSFWREKRPYRQNQFGFAVGGPVILPKFNGRDKSFFFLNYEGTRIRQGRTFNTIVPSEAFRRGDFSSLSTPIRDPLTGDPFPGNVIPPNRINPATALLSAVHAGTEYRHGNIRVCCPVQQRPESGQCAIRPRVQQQGFACGSLQHQPPRSFNPGAYPSNGGSNQRQRVQNLVGSQTHIFSPAMINELAIRLHADA